MLGFLYFNVIFLARATGFYLDTYRKYSYKKRRDFKEKIVKFIRISCLIIFCSVQLYYFGWEKATAIIADVCILGITVFTFHKTYFSTHLVLGSVSVNLRSFEGDNISITIINKTFRPICISRIIIVAKVEQNFYIIEQKKFEQYCILNKLEAMKVEGEQFSFIGIREKDLGRIHENVVVGVEDENKKMIWLKDNNPNHQELVDFYSPEKSRVFIGRYTDGDLVLPQHIKYKVVVWYKDCDNHKKVFEAYGFKSGLFFRKGKMLFSIESERELTIAIIKREFSKKMNVSQKDIIVQEIKPLF